MALHEQQLKHIKSWQVSGASKAVYCQNNGLCKWCSKTAYTWLQKPIALSKNNSNIALQ